MPIDSFWTTAQVNINPINEIANGSPQPSPEAGASFANAMATLQAQAAAQIVLEHVSTNAVLDEMPYRAAMKKELKQVYTGNRPISSLINYVSIKDLPSKTHQYMQAVPVKKPYTFCSNDVYIGIEVEVENIKNPTTPEFFWQVKPDGSLRNNGVEYVSAPILSKDIPQAIEYLNQVLTCNNKPDFSNRTSTHIHLNCRDLTQDEIWNLVILYSIFEKHFYKVAGTKRLNSIFCVPLYRCNILHNLDQMIYTQDTGSWTKYCGLNLLPLYPNTITGTYGTIEFRHLYGTTDPDIIYEWVDYILALRLLAKEMTKEELVFLLKQMNTTSEYKHLYYRFLRNLKPLITTNQEFESCISNIKRELFGNDYMTTIKPTTNSTYWTVCREQNIAG